MGDLLVEISDDLGEPVVVLNLPGASGSIATMRLVNALADGYTVEIGTPREISTATLVNPNITYDVERDFTYVALGGRSPIVIASGPTLKNTKTFADLVVEARKRPQGLTYATSGVGSPQNFLGELIKQRFGINLVHVPFSGGTGGLLEVLSGNVDITDHHVVESLQYIQFWQANCLRHCGTEAHAARAGHTGACRKQGTRRRPRHGHMVRAPCASQDAVCDYHTSRSVIPWRAQGPGSASEAASARHHGYHRGTPSTSKLTRAVILRSTHIVSATHMQLAKPSK